MLEHRTGGVPVSGTATLDYCIRATAEMLAAEAEAKRNLEATAREYSLLIELAEARSELQRLKDGG